MKTILSSALLIFGLTCFAQTPATKTPAAQTQASTTLSPKAKSLCKEWSLSQTENFGDVHKPSDEQKSDRLVLAESGNYRLIMNGKAEGGSWSLDKSNTWLTLTAADGTIKKFKVLESTETSLKVDYRDADDIHNILYYTAATPVNQQK
jgi:hypothetical protein